MAKKRKRLDEAKEEREYRPPEFDRKEYVRTEVDVSKATIIAAIFSIPMGLAAMYVMPVGGFGGGLVVGLTGIGILWFLLPKTGVETRPFKPMQWAGVMSTYFLVFLAVWVVACNPPFQDMASPRVLDVRVGYMGANNTTVWTNVSVSETGAHVAKIANFSQNTAITIRANVTDNKMLDKSNVTVTINKESNEHYAMEHLQNNLFQAAIPNVTDTFDYVITANDLEGNTIEYRFTIQT